MKISKFLIVSLCFIAFAFANSAHAYDATFSLGNLCEYVGKIQTDELGSKNLCSANPYLAASLDYSFTSELLISPEIGFTIPKSGRDETINEMSITFLLNTKYKFSAFHLIGGAGLFFTRLSVGGGSEVLNNGASTTTFPLPEGTIYSRNLIINLGLGADFLQDYSADIHTYIFNLFTKEERAFSIAINGTYHFGEF